MADIILNGMIDKDHRLVVDVPESIPPGPVEVVLRRAANSSEQPHTLTRDEAHAKFLAAGIKPVQYPEIADFVPMSEEEFQAFVAGLPKGGTPSEQIVDEDRGEH